MRRAPGATPRRACALARLSVTWSASLVVACAPAESREGTPRPPDSATRRASESLARLMAEPASWTSYGGDYTNRRFSRLTQITASNVHTLELTWHYRTGVVREFETSPLVIGRTMYLTTALDHVIALDAVTGARRWEYVHPLTTTIICCGPVNRGLAYFDGKVFLGTLDAKLVALDTGDGTPRWTTQVADNTRGYAETMAPVAADGHVFIGVSGAEYGIRGSVSSYDARTGRLEWRWHTIPSPAEGGWWGRWRPADDWGTPFHRDIVAERADSARYPDAWKTGGGSVWQTPALDLERGLLVLTVNNPSPDVDGTVRPGDNLYTDCIVALDYRTGKLQWYFQEVSHDVWDYDPISPPVLVDVRDDSGETVPAVAQAGKTGWVYVVNRDNGRPLRRSEAFVPQQNIFAQPTRAGVLVAPGGNGGSEWSPTAVDPRLGYMYVLGLHQPDTYKLRPEVFRPGASWLAGVWLSASPRSEGGTFSAVDLNTGRIAWQQRLPDPMVGGALATAGGVVFTGAKDGRVLAYDSRTGQELWHYAASAGVNAPPVTYAVDGVQYVAVAAGGNLQINAPRGDEMLVFALGTPGTSTAPPLPPARGSASPTLLPRR